MNFLRVAKKSNSIRCIWNTEVKFERNDTPESIIFHLQPLNNCELL